MQRILEPELMDDLAQAKAYHEADFSEAHGQRVDLFLARAPRDKLTGAVLDIGCGSGDIVFRFARALGDIRITAVDGSEAMLGIAREAIAQEVDIKDRVAFIKAFIPNDPIPKKDYSMIMSHSFLHHLHRPAALWETIKKYAQSDTFVFVADLRRPNSVEAAQQVIDEQAANEPEVLRVDYFNSLCAAFTAEEIQQQLNEADLKLTIEEAGENHVLIYGQI